mgnify:CR=1 FL=1
MRSRRIDASRRTNLSIWNSKVSGLRDLRSKYVETIDERAFTDPSLNRTNSAAVLKPSDRTIAQASESRISESKLSRGGCPIRLTKKLRMIREAGSLRALITFWEALTIRFPISDCSKIERMTLLAAPLQST